MADAKKTETPPEGEAPKKKSKLLLIIIVAVLVLVLAGGGAAFFLLKKKSQTEDEADAEEDTHASVTKKKKKDDHATPPAFVKLEPFVVKLQGEQQQENYVQAIPELKLVEAHAADQVKQFTPEIRHKVLLILAGKKASELSTPEGMQILANQIRVSINSTLTGEKAKEGAEKLDEDENGPIIAVFLSSLIVQ